MGNYLSDRRIAVGLTQKDVADAVNVSISTVSRWESGDIANMRRDRIAKLAIVLHTTPEFIMTGHEDDSPTPLPPSDDDLQILAAYHAAPASIQTGIKALLEPYMPVQVEEAAIS